MDLITASKLLASLWSRTIGSYTASSPAIVDGRVYMGLGDLGSDVYSLDAVSGEIVWRYTAGGWVYSGPAVVDGTVYVGSRDGKVYELPVNDPNGDGTISESEVIWSYPTGERVFSSPAGTEGRVYICSNDAFPFFIMVQDLLASSIIEQLSCLTHALSLVKVPSS